MLNKGKLSIFIVTQIPRLDFILILGLCRKSACEDRSRGYLMASSGMISSVLVLLVYLARKNSCRG